MDRVVKFEAEAYTNVELVETTSGARSYQHPTRFLARVKKDLGSVSAFRVDAGDPWTVSSQAV
jgi:hypothetical protein